MQLNSKNKMYLIWGLIGVAVLCMWGNHISNENKREEEEAAQKAFRAKVVNPIIREVSKLGEPTQDENSPYEAGELLAKLRHYEQAARAKHEEGKGIYTDMEEKQGNELPDKELRQWHANSGKVQEICGEITRCKEDSHNTYDAQLKHWEAVAVAEKGKEAELDTYEELEKQLEKLIKQAATRHGSVELSETARFGYQGDIKKLKRNLAQLRKQNEDMRQKRAELARVKAILIGDDNKVKLESEPIREARRLLTQIDNFGIFDVNVLAHPMRMPDPPPPPPFEPDVHIVATGDLSATLLEPLIVAWLQDRRATPLKGKSFIWDMPDENTREIEVNVPEHLQGKDTGILRIRITSEGVGSRVFKHIQRGKSDADMVLTGRKMNKLEEVEWLPVNTSLADLDTEMHGRAYRTRLCSDALLFFRGNNMNVSCIRQTELKKHAMVFSTDDSGRTEVSSIFGLTPETKDMSVTTKGKSIQKLAAEHGGEIILGCWHKDSLTRSSMQAMSVNNNPTLSYAAGMNHDEALKHADKRYVTNDAGCAPTESTINSGQYAYSYNITFYRATETRETARAAADLMRWAGDVENKNVEALVRNKGYVPVQAVQVDPNSKLTNADLPLEVVLPKLESWGFGYTPGASGWVYGARVAIPLYYEVGSATASGASASIDPDSQYYTDMQALQIIRTLTEGRKAALVLVGHADPQWGKKLDVSQESWRRNLDLSNKRANIVYTTLFSKALKDSADFKHLSFGCSWARPACDLDMDKPLEHQDRELSRCRRADVFVIFPLPEAE